jgi:protein-L-isoaspartate(D-aspartate) O-methyltransferase
MLFSWKKNRTKKKFFLNKNNDDLLVELREKGITNKNILNAIKKVPRELFVNEISIQWAYENIPLPIDCEQTISQPYVVAYMIDCLKLKKTDKVLEIGTGTGYQTAIISHLCQKIYTIEIFDKLFHQAKTNINKLKIRNAIYKLGNGTNGWEKEILFDAIIVSAASEKIPLRLLQNLKNYGNLIIPKKYPSGNQKLILIKKTSKNDFDQKELFDVKFVPLLNTNIEY